MKDIRRKFLGSALATPLVLTVRQASAHAKTSLVACLERDGKRRVDDILAHSSHSDEMMRAKVDILELSYWDDRKNKWVEIEDRRFILGFDKSTYWQLDRDDPYRSPASPSQYRKGSGIREKKKGERHALVYVKDDGRIVGMGWEKRGGTQCSKSCWASLVPKQHA